MSEICPLTLYHGTSSIFLESILQNGLGGQNIVKEWKIVELLNEIYPLAQKYLPDHVELGSLKQMADQSSSPGANFQHGDVYLTLSKRTAMEYTIKKDMVLKF